MTNISEGDTPHSSSPLAGLVPSRLHAENTPAQRDVGSRERSRFVKSMFNTVPIVLVGSIAMAGMNFSGAIEPIEAKRPPKDKFEATDIAATVKNALAAANAAEAPLAQESAGVLQTASAPSTYRVKGGDTVSGIAGRYGLSTASVLALNGLGWKSVIFPGQVLKLVKGGTPPKTATKPGPASTSAQTTSTARYTIRKGDTISAIAQKFGVSAQAVLNANKLSWSSTIYAGRTLAIPGKGSPTTTPPAAKPPVAQPPVAAPPVVTPPAPGRSYTIKSGDTISTIAKKFAVSVQSILSANGLSSSSMIYAGRVLTIPTIASASVGDKVTPLSPEMSANATIIIKVGRQLGVPDYGIVVALAAAMQESSLRNINYGDRDSIGLFQQRPSAGWGSNSQLLDPVYASRLFYGGPTNPNKGKTRGLLEVPNWQKLSVTKAAQAVQISAFPNAYAKWETSARAWFAALS